MAHSVMENIQDLVDAAVQQRWEYVDSRIPQLCHSIPSAKPYVAWAHETGLEDKRDDVRDLGATIIQKSPILKQRFHGMKEKIYMKMDSDTHFYVQFRLACAFVEHDPEPYESDIIEILQRATTDDDEEVVEEAKRYISRLSERGK